MLPGAWYNQLGEPATWGVLGYAVALFLFGWNHAGPWGIGSRNRRIGAFVVLGLPTIYVLCLIPSGAPATEWIVQGAGLLVWCSAAVAGLRRGWLLWAACLLHAAWDLGHLSSAYVPEWYARACIIVDVSLAVFLWLRIRERDRTDGSEADPVGAHS